MLLKLLKSPVFRIFAYVLLFLIFVFLDNFSFEQLSICPFERFFDVTCVGCGTTRAFVKIMQFDFSGAFELNPLFTAFIFPASVLVFIQDIICSVMSFCGKIRLSFADFILLTLFGEEK